MIQTQKHPIVAQLEAEIDKTLQSFGYELVQLKFGGPRHNPTLSIYLEKPGGVTTADCQYMAERLSVLLDVLDPIPGRYSLLVSSPGLNRPLTRDEDFDRFAGHTAAVTYRDEEGKRATVRGLLQGTSDGELQIQVEAGEVRLPLDQIEQAHLVHEWQDAD